MKKIAVVFLSFILLVSIPHSTKSDIIVHEGESIQDAINNAMPGDTIIIEGTFHENIIVNKSIVIIGKNAKVYGINGSVFNITSSNVTLDNISIYNSDHAVVFIKENAIIKNCNIGYGRYGIVAKGGARIKNCNISRAGSGAVIYGGSVISGSSFFRCGIGIECYGSGNMILNTSAKYCGVALSMENASLNTVERCHFYRNNNNECAVFMLSSNNNIIKNCDISYVSFGIRMLNCQNNKIEESKLHDMRYGIEYENCQNCTVNRCSIYNNRFGLEVIKSRNMVFSYNDIESRMYNLHARFSYCDARHNYWSSILPAKIKSEASIVRKIPWLIHPIYGEKQIFREEGRGREENRYAHFHSFNKISSKDFDPLVDIKVIFVVKRIRSFDMGKYMLSVKIDGMKNSTFFEGDVFPYWKAIQNVDDGKQMVDIDISIEGERKHIYYDLATGNWYGDDYLGDNDGYGHIVMNGYEIWFDVTYNDFDGDGLTYWEEENVYHTSPYENNANDDFDNDGIPFWWEDKYGFNPLKWENHSQDMDNDGLSNFDEYAMEKNLSDPFSKDIFLEIDYMQGFKIPQESIEMICNAFARHNITIHIFVDDELPYTEKLFYRNLIEIYWKYFLDGDMNNIKHGIFHYEVIGAYSSIPRGGHAFVGWDNLDSFMLAGKYINEWRRGYGRKIAYASLTMHELGHTLGLFEYTFPGIDNESCNAPWLKGYWIYRNYRSCLNYRYAFNVVDYSNGKHGRNDFDDWGNIDLTFFTHSYYYP